jgi:hypothetical protein
MYFNLAYQHAYRSNTYVSSTLDSRNWLVRDSKESIPVRISYVELAEFSPRQLNEPEFKKP